MDFEILCLMDVLGSSKSYWWTSGKVLEGFLTMTLIHPHLSTSACTELGWRRREAGQVSGSPAALEPPSASRPPSAWSPAPHREGPLRQSGSQPGRQGPMCPDPAFPFIAISCCPLAAPAPYPNPPPAWPCAVSPRSPRCLCLGSALCLEHHFRSFAQRPPFVKYHPSAVLPESSLFP